MTIDHSGARAVRRATPADLPAIYDICLRTADAGVDATALYGDPQMPGIVWAAPYAVFEPDFTFVLGDGDRPALGYVLAVPDTIAFEKRLEAEWWPEARKRFADFTPRNEAEANALRHIVSPEHHGDELLAKYPAHLHINLLPEAQGSGWGRRLIDTELEALQAAGIKGVQLGVSPTNERAKGFYRRLGFTDVSRDGKVTFAMSLS
jgi:ribosomal protein S18 acetylase RimI-like enzyme